MHTSPNGRKLIESFEGLFLQAYDDANDRIVQIGQPVHGTLTIGYGHTSAAGPPHVYVGMVITQPQADAILSADLASVELEVSHLVTAPLNQNQFDALVSFQYNTGWLAHPNCSLLHAVNAQNRPTIDADFMLYDRANGQVLTGLIRRRIAERTLFDTPIASAKKKALSTTA
jgi:lysozyme